MKLSNKDKILIALYIEYKKNSPKIEQNIAIEKMDMEYKDFVYELNRLQNEGLIDNVSFAKDHGESSIAWYNNAIITDKGEDYIENKIGIQHTMTSQEKIKFIAANAVSWGWEQLKDVAARTIAEMNR